ncbi:glycine cleavage system aminomethyltransferase GcvT [Mariprofundus erugo]|uniref:aminomethyltransferase n=1 Tax=Mariprofundus erugo TaxID=2528639 RepID=A0A5R9H127_9PROT|nr:glycine cleavage system aminomethyltransferase GcvT [Mariprofundus erugo]TLS68654.1 glycine cleavage system aminomethyltransferase GcvT [Mariprofundus erugo]TLS77653.1 glycine cleavage system aminomethyltransferase GcvT [Mariprofundus erugo]
MSELAKTPLFDEHVALGGKMVPFAGFEMPVQYKNGALKEYTSVREGGAGLFDITHMGQVRVTGAGALAFLQYVTTNDVSKLAEGQVHYSALLDDAGTFIDDITTYKISDDAYYLCINAANRHKDVAHLQAQAASFDVAVVDESDETTLLALQGAAAQAALQPLVDGDLDAIGYYKFAEVKVSGVDAIVSRTGYTGEDGFEIYIPNAIAVDVWRQLLANGALPIGLAARDMLRTEMGYALYGHEISDAVTPVEAKLMWITKLDKGDFIGSAAVAARKAEGPRQRLIALKLTGRGIPREHYKVFVDGVESGEVTSGMHSPMAGGVALAYVKPEHAEAGALSVEIRGKLVDAERTTLPFVRSNVRK